MSPAAAWRVRADVVVVGAGVGGLSAALAAARCGRRVLVVDKASGPPGADTATRYAQGGIAVVLPDGDDALSDHVADTVAAGAGLCDRAAVVSIVADGYRAVSRLVGAGARFDTDSTGRWELTREGGHHRRRIVHAGGDATGAEVQRALRAAVSGLDIRGGLTVLQILRDGSEGAFANRAAVTGLLASGVDGVGVIDCAAIVLATGGLGQLYRATTNPGGATGDGISLALRAGATVSDIEFVQFHPTMLFGEAVGQRRSLITEAVRGEGGVLIDARGDSVTAGVHPMGDLAPRDVVAAAIDARLRESGDVCVYLDARPIAGFAGRFPTVYASCRAAGIDPVRQPIPVVPGAHYSCGGISTDVAGRTGVPGLFAVGEAARTGMHGANRLASNSLLEGLVVGDRAGEAAAAHCASAGVGTAPMPELAVQPALARDVLQQAMSQCAAVTRDADTLARLTDTLADAQHRPVRQRRDAEEAALTLTARTVAAAALARTETRGCHHRDDHPDTENTWARNITARLVDGVIRIDVPVDAPQPVC